ncbi:hypothetical protein ACF0H5_016448 [Mactra antiquata]
MAERANSCLYREIFVPNSTGTKWKEISLNIGASASTLQDIKVADSCGGYTYRDSSLPTSFVRNRYIHWKVNNDILELEEESLDLELFGSKVKFHFQDTAILAGVSIHESQGFVIVLVPTVASVHRLIFPHPNKLQNADFGYIPSDQPLPSIFHDASIAKCMDARNFHMLNPGGTITSHFTAAASFYTQEGEGLFALANSSGNILLVKMPPLGMQGIVQQFELCPTSVMQKIWSGLVPSVMSFRSGQEPSHSVCSLVIQPVRGEACIFAVCRDHRLRVWSCKTHECMVVTNLLDFCVEGSTLQSASPAGSGHMIRKLVSTNLADMKLGIHLNFNNSNQFCIVQPQVTSGRLQIVHQATEYGPQEDLIDYCMTNTTLVSLWTSSSGTSVVRTLTFGDEGPGPWMEVLMQAGEVADFNIPEYSDPREVYLDRLFQPGRFSKQDIRRALSLQVYAQSLEPSLSSDMALNVNTLKGDVTIAVESEIRSAAVDYEMVEEDYYQLQLEQWTKFYSCCIQYHEVGGKLKGLFADSVTGLVGLVRKGCVTYLRPCDAVEELYFDSEQADPSNLLEDINITDDVSANENLSLLFGVLHIINLEMSEDLASKFEHELTVGNSLDLVTRDLVEHVILNQDLENTMADSANISHMLSIIDDLPKTINMVLQYLDLSTNTEDEYGTEINPVQQMNLSRLFTSKTGCDILTMCTEQFSVTRFNILRDLYLLQTAALRLGAQIGINPEGASAIKGDLLPLTANLLRSYLVVKWASQTTAVSAQINTLECNIRQLSSLEISDVSGLTGQQMGSNLVQKIDHNGASLMELFIQGPGGDKMRNILSSTSFLEEEPGAVWSSGLMKIVKCLASLIWPLSEQFVFAEFLISHCQYLPLQGYCNLLQYWCDYNPSSRLFMMGLAYLHFDEPVKAAQCFDEAREGVSTERFLQDRLLQTHETDERKLKVLYYLKVIRQFEEYSAPDVVITLARNAKTVAEDNDPNLPTLYSKVFKYQLELGHNTEAYNAMIENPDPSRRKDCLRQLLINLCDRGDLQSLVDFKYTDLEDEVETILESRARCMDLTTHNYYDLLYAFHIYKNNYRKAGSVMYEQGMRLGCEVPGKQGLQRQAQCYLSALNALRLVKPEYSWIIKPTLVSKQNLGAGDSYMRSSKRGIDGEQIDNTVSKFQILELHDIEKEFMLVDARLRLLATDNDPSLLAGSTPGADEMVRLLLNAGMYDRAVIVSRAFDLPLNPIFESLTLRCINLAKNSSYYMRGDNDYTSQAWEWLKTNNLTLTNISRENSSADEAWQLLQQYLDKYEDRKGQYHRCAASKLLTYGFTLPAWLVNSYKGLNSAELLKLYIDHNLLEEGVNLCKEYIEAVLDTFKGVDSQLFQIKGCLRNEALSVWLPYTSIDKLLQALDEHKQNSHVDKMNKSLQTLLNIYVTKLRERSETVLQPS